MQTITLAHDLDLDGWREAARWLYKQGIAPEDVMWRVGNEITNLFENYEECPSPLRDRTRTSVLVADRSDEGDQHLLRQPEAPSPDASHHPLPQGRGTNLQSIVKVPRAFIELVETVIMVRDPARFDLLYRMFWRLQHGEKHLLDTPTDTDVHCAYRFTKAIRRDIHKMRAFVRFREVMQDGVAHYIAWFEPQHHILEANAPFFTGRFANMRWSILTPDRCMHWDTEQLTYTVGADKSAAPDEDALESYWLTYFSNIFNPARLKINAMQKEMPRKYWHNLPEAELIAPLIRDADRRTREMIAKATSKTNKYDEFEVVNNKLQRR